MFTGFRGVVAAAVVALGMTSGQREPGVVGEVQGEVAPSVTAPTPPKVDLGGLPPEAVAKWVAEEVAKFSWDAPRREASDGENCEPYRPVLSVPYADEQWCQRCRREEGGASVETFFYSFDLEEPLACRLQQVRAHATASNASEIHAALARRLDAAHGPGQIPDDVQGFGAAYWKDVRRWESGSVEILLYVEKRIEHAPTLGLRARHRRLANAIARGDALYWKRDALWTAALEGELREALQSDHSDVVRLLAANGSKSSTERATALVRLLDEAPGAPRGRRAALLLLGDRLAARLNVGEYESPDWDEQRSQLGERNLSFYWSHLGSVWAYEHDLLKRVAKEFPDTAWGEWASLILLGGGWDSSPSLCETNVRLVIEQGKRFLDEHSDTPQRTRVLLVLAEAYETWFSLSRARVDDYTNPSDYEDGADGARDKAIGYYETLLQLAPTSAEAAYAQWALPRLKLSVATQQRRFLCFND